MMAMLVDTHTHLYLPEFESPAAAVKQAIEAGVGHMILPNVDLDTVGPLLELHSMFPHSTSVALGLHPTEVGDDVYAQLARMRTHIDANRHLLKAIGEIGIDLYWDTSRLDSQIKAFATQVDWAAELRLPVIIHCREGLDEVLRILADAPVCPKGVMHSFSGTADDIERILRVAPGMYFGINGIVTFKNSRLREVIPAIPADRLLLETDSPYLAPVPMRGRRNCSAYLIHTAAHVAAALGIGVDELAALTSANATRLFDLDINH